MGNTRTVDLHVQRMRKKLDLEDKIVAVYKIGYRLEVQVLKLFWKIFFSVMIICVSCFSIGSYILINNNFKTSLDREIKNTYTENEILNGILSQELADVSDMYIQCAELNSGNEGYTKSKWIKQIAPNININSGNGKMLYRIVDVNGCLLYTSGL